MILWDKIVDVMRLWTVNECWDGLFWQELAMGSGHYHMCSKYLDEKDGECQTARTRASVGSERMIMKEVSGRCPSSSMEFGFKFDGEEV